MIAVALVYDDREPGETYNVRYSEKHRWVYVRGMEIDKGVLIKWYVVFFRLIDTMLTSAWTSVLTVLRMEASRR